MKFLIRKRKEICKMAAPLYIVNRRQKPIFENPSADYLSTSLFTASYVFWACLPRTPCYDAETRNASKLLHGIQHNPIQSFFRYRDATNIRSISITWGACRAALFYGLIGRAPIAYFQTPYCWGMVRGHQPLQCSTRVPVLYFLLRCKDKKRFEIASGQNLWSGHEL